MTKLCGVILLSNLSKIENDLVSEIGLNPLEAKVFLLVTTQGMMSVKQISQILKIEKNTVQVTAKRLQELGAFIDMPELNFEAMHPRFTAVNMYRKSCQRKNIEFKRNKIVDNIGVVLERPYEEARTGKPTGLA